MENGVVIFSNEDIIDNIIIWLCDQDFKKGQIKSLLTANQPSITDDESELLIKKAFEKLAAIQKEQYTSEKVIPDHITKYEFIYDYYNQINHAAGCGKTMLAKERLLGIMKDRNSLNIKSKQTKVYFSQVEYDINQLTPYEQDRYKYLLKKGLKNEKEQ